MKAKIAEAREAGIETFKIQTPSGLHKFQVNPPRILWRERPDGTRQTIRHRDDRRDRRGDGTARRPEDAPALDGQTHRTHMGREDREKELRRQKRREERDNANRNRAGHRDRGLSVPFSSDIVGLADHERLLGSVLRVAGDDDINSLGIVTDVAPGVGGGASERRAAAAESAQKRRNSLASAEQRKNNPDSANISKNNTPRRAQTPSTSKHGSKDPKVGAGAVMIGVGDFKGLDRNDISMDLEKSRRPPENIAMQIQQPESIDPPDGGEKTFCDHCNRLFELCDCADSDRDHNQNGHFSLGNDAHNDQHFASNDILALNDAQAKQLVSDYQNAERSMSYAGYAPRLSKLNYTFSAEDEGSVSQAPYAPEESTNSHERVLVCEREPTAIEAEWDGTVLGRIGQTASLVAGAEAETLAQARALRSRYASPLMLMLFLALVTILALVLRPSE